MTNLWQLLKINLLSFFDIYKIKNAKDKSELKKAIFKVVLIVGLFLYLGLYLYQFCRQTLLGLKQLNIPYLLLTEFMAISSVYVLFTNIFRVNKTIFNYKDYDLLMSLPIKKSTVILSKFSTLYVSSFIYILLFMIPAFLAYIKDIAVNPIFYILFIITLFVLPLVPIVIAVIIGSILTTISSKIKHKNIGEFIITMLFVLGLMYFSFSFKNVNTIDMANIGQSIVNLFNKIYPLTKLYMNIINDYNLVSLLIYIFIPALLFILFLLGINKYYEKINTRLKTNFTTSNYKVTKLKTNSQLKALYKKELKRYFSSTTYVINTSMGVIFLLLSIILYITVGADKLDSIIGIEGLSNLFVKNTPILIGAFCALNCTTAPSISLEGNSLWIPKSIPVKPIKIFLSKIMVNLTMIIPATFLASIILTIYLKLPIITLTLMILTSIIYSLFVAMLGLVLDLTWPNFNWKTEIKVIKQSFPSFAIICIGLVMAIIPFNIKYTCSDNVFALIIILSILLLDILLVVYLITKGTKRFKEL